MSVRIDHEQGMILPMVIFIMLILSVLGTALLTQSDFSSRVVTIGDSKMQAHYVAESGAKAVAQYLINYPDKLATIPDGSSSNWTELVAGHNFKVAVTRNFIPGTEVISSITITSTGEVSSGSTVSNSTVHTMLYGNTDTGFSWENAVWDGND